RLDEKLKTGMDVTQAVVEAVLEKQRADAITKLNAEVKPDPYMYSAPAQPGDTESGEATVKKPRKPRGPNKKKVDFGASEVPASAQAVAVNPEPALSPAAPVA